MVCRSSLWEKYSFVHSLSSEIKDCSDCFLPSFPHFQHLVSCLFVWQTLIRDLGEKQEKEFLSGPTYEQTSMRTF